MYIEQTIFINITMAQCMHVGLAESLTEYIKGCAVPLEFLKTSYLLHSCKAMLSCQPKKKVPIKNIYGHWSHLEYESKT